MFKEFVQNIKSGDLILTANKRLANYLRGEIDQFQCNSAKVTWESPCILPFDTWLKEFYQSNKLEPTRLLSPAQSLFLWHKIIGSSLEMAVLAQQSWLLMQQWELDEQATDPVFGVWAKAYQHYCDEHHFIDEASIPKKIIDIVSKNPRTVPQRIHLVGFDNISKIINKLFDCIKFNSDLKIHHFYTENSRVAVLELKDSMDELQSAALWIKNKREHKPDGKYACVVPDLPSFRDRALQVFSDILGDALINVSIGKSLLTYPLIANALRILDLLKRESDLFQVCAVLRSPYILGSSAEYFQRIRCDNEWRESGGLFPDFNVLANEETAPIWQALWTRFLHFLETIPQEQKPSDWAKTFEAMLECFGWPGELVLTETEIGCVERWYEILNDMRSQDSVLKSVSLDEGLAILNHLIKGAVFQLPTLDARVHLMGILESTGLLFDGLWVMGLDDETWPQALQVNPLVDAQIQRQNKMPRSHPQHEFAYAENVLDRLKNAASEVIFSYSIFEKDKSLQASPLLNKFPKINRSDLKFAEFIPLSHQIYHQREIEEFEDSFAPPVSNDETIRGGSYILKAQAVCPFKAFAEIRLNARGLDAPTLGPEAKDRGNLVHDILAKIWKELRSSRNLQAISMDELQQRIQGIINNTVDNTSAFAKIEKIRLEKLITQWLEYEKKRKPFKVFNIEKNQTISIGGLTLECRIDRIDQLEDESYVIIDYKTGSSSPSSWFGERPDEPQLPLYSLATNLPISALTFAECRVDNQQFKGISVVSDILPDVKSIEKYDYEWNELVSEWKDYLSQLASDFLKGKATVDPKDPSLNCQFCEIYSLCRIR